MNTYINREKAKAHLEERVAYYAMIANRQLNEDYDCCKYAETMGYLQAYEDMLIELNSIPF